MNKYEFGIRVQFVQGVLSKMIQQYRMKLLPSFGKKEFYASSEGNESTKMELNDSREFDV